MAKPNRQPEPRAAPPSVGRDRRESWRRCLSQQGEFRRGSVIHRLLEALTKSSNDKQNTGPRRSPGRRIRGQTPGQTTISWQQTRSTLPAMAKPSWHPLPFCTAECRPWPAGIVASLSEPAGRVSTRPAGRGRSEGTGVAGGAAGGASLVTCLSPQESNSPAGARPGQSPQIKGTHR